MADKEYDVAVIGAGPAGYVACIRAAQLGLKVACVEKSATTGGTCLNVGCIPSKALLQSSEYYEMMLKHGKDHGILCKELALDFPEMMKRKEKIVSGLTTGVKGLLKKNKVDLVHGAAKFVTPRMLEIHPTNAPMTTLKAKNFILATGSTSIELPFLPFDEKQVVSSTGALSLPEVPKKLIVVGAGVIGVELASVYRRLGSEVTIVEMLEMITPGIDAPIAKLLYQTLTKQGLNFRLGARVESGKVDANGVSLEISCDGKKESLKGDVVLVGVGRRPYSDGLGLDEIDVVRDSKGFVHVDDQFRTTVPNIYAIGDLIDGVMLAHRASEEGVAVAEILAGNTPHINYMTVPNIIYTNPEVAGVGFTEAEAKDVGLNIMTGTFPFRANARARCSGEDEGLVKVIGDKTTGRLLGLHIIGQNASEMIHEGVVALEKQATVEDLANMCHGHPTLSEAIKEAALSTLKRTIHL
jgi:dihydrolipoamide dehydrogenase